jgi:hypothetical protein
VFELEDLTDLNWNTQPNTTGTRGCFVKCVDSSVEPKYYYKASNYNSDWGFYGHESINELIIYRLGSILGFNCLDYRLIHAKITYNNVYNTYITRSRTFNRPGYSKLNIEKVLDKETNRYEACVKLGLESYINSILVLDYLTLNRDRHGANITILKRDRDGGYHTCSNL